MMVNIDVIRIKSPSLPLSRFRYRSGTFGIDLVVVCFDRCLGYLCLIPIFKQSFWNIGPVIL